MRNFLFNWLSNSTSKRAVQIIAGDFAYLTRSDISNIHKTIQNQAPHIKPLIYVFDRDEIQVPANERAHWLRAELPPVHVNVVYGAPSIKSDNASDNLNKYIASVTPQQFLIHDVFLADLKTPSEIPQAQMLSDSSRRRLVNHFKHSIDSDEFNELIESHSFQIKSKILIQNPNHPNREDFFKRTVWDLSQLNKINKPILIDKISNPCEQNRFSSSRNTQVFDMPIFMPKQGWKIPYEFSFLQNTLAKITAAEQLSNPDIENCNVYMTYDNGLVYPNTYARRGGLHVDGFLTQANRESNKVTYGDHTYLVSSQSALQTRCHYGPFDLSSVNVNNPKEVLEAFDKQVSNYIQFNAYDIVLLTTNHVHAVQPNLTNDILPRAFLKVTFSDRFFNRSGNTINPLLDYKFSYVTRNVNERNTQNYIGEVPPGYKEVSLKELEFSKNHLPDWVESKIEKVCKNTKVCVTAIKAIPGEKLITKVGSDIVTVNTAQEGDMKICREGEDSYFLGKSFLKLYTPTSKKDQFEPTTRELLAVKTNKNISFTAPWGTRQNIKQGGYIVQDVNNEMWGVHEDSFKATYKVK